MKKCEIASLIVVTFFMASLSEASAQGGYATTVNRNRPGERIRIGDYIRSDQIVVVDFFSEYCGPCRRFAPALEALDRASRNVTVIKFDINRRGVQGIDGRSPLAQQYGIDAVPYIMIFDEGRLISKGKNARTVLMKIIDEVDRGRL
jgi:thioredoxin 1